MSASSVGSSAAREHPTSESSEQRTWPQWLPQDLLEWVFAVVMLSLALTLVLVVVLTLTGHVNDTVATVTVSSTSCQVTS